MAAAAAVVGGGMLSAYGQMQMGAAGKQAAEYNARIAEQNAVLARQQAAEDERKFRSAMRTHIGDQRAAIGASGIQLEGSPMEVLQDTAARAEEDALNIRRQGDLKAYGFQSEAALQRYQGEAGMTGAMFGAAGTLLSAAGNAYSKMPVRR